MSNGHLAQRKGNISGLSLLALCLAAVLFLATGRSVGQQVILGSMKASTGTSPYLLIGGGLSFNYSTAQIDAFDGSLQCGVFQRSSGSHPFFNIGYSTEVGVLRLTPKAYYEDLSTQFTIDANPTANTPLAYRASTGTYVPISRTRNYAASLNSVGIECEVSYSPIEHLSVGAAPVLGWYSKKQFMETEQITGPLDAVYAENNLRTRTIRSGAIASNVVAAYLQLGAEYDFRLQPRLSIAPLVRFRIPLVQLSTSPSQNWRLYPLETGISLRYNLESGIMSQDPIITTVPIKSEPPQAVVVAAKRSILRATIGAVGYSDAGEALKEPTLRVDRVHVTEVIPTLNYIFFDDGSNSIAARYLGENKMGSEGHVNEISNTTIDAFQLNHRLLDILGERLQKLPKTRIAITGTRSLHSPGDSHTNASLGLERARNIAKYLETYWKIAPARMTVRGRDLPEIPSDDLNVSGQAENRRVEITSSDTKVIGPFWSERIEKVATPPRINFQPSVESNFGIRQAEIIIRQGNRILDRIDALRDTSHGSYTWTIDSGSFPNDRGSVRDSLIYEFHVTDSTGEETIASGVLPLRYELHDTTVRKKDVSFDKSVERFSLILFDYSSARVNQSQTQEIVQDIANAVTEGATMSLTGHTDQTGDEDYNDKLSAVRAQRAYILVKKEVETLGKALPTVEVKSRGSRDRLFDNTVPEGRFLSRTVRAVIEHVNTDMPVPNR